MDTPSQHSSMFEPPFWSQIKKSSKNILLAGMGGGYDVFTAIPIWFELDAMRVGNEKRFGNLVLANLSFTPNLSKREGGKWITPRCVEVLYDEYVKSGKTHLYEEKTGWPNNYYAEWHLSKWFYEKHNRNVPVVAFDLEAPITVDELTTAFQKLIELYQIDTIVLIDAGVDSLLKHDEQGLGTFGEDLMSIMAAQRVNVPYKYLMTVGAGTEGGISEYDFLENWSALIKKGGCLGSISWMKETYSVQQYMDAYYACVPTNSTINAQIIAGIEGHWKHYVPPHIISRGVREQDMFITPFMSICWFWDLKTLIDYKLFMNEVADSTTLSNLQKKLEGERMKTGLTSKTGDFQGTRTYVNMFHGRSSHNTY